MTFEQIIADLLSNDNFKAGTGVFAVVATTTVLKRGLGLLQTFIRRNYTMTMEVPNTDKSYSWLSPWVIKQTKTTHISIETAFNRNESGKIESNYQFVPSPGVHYLFYKGRILRAERSRTQPTNMMGSGSMPFESLTLSTIGHDRKFFNSILETAKIDALSYESGWTIIYKAIGAEWRPFGYPRARRPISSVILDGDLTDSILNDVKEFLDNQSWYEERGIPYRRGYLLHGPPGCGKTSFIAALAGELQYNVCVVSLSEIGMSGDRLDHLLSHAPLQSIILLEDIDAAFGDRSQLYDNPAYQGLQGLTLSGVLNALDGVACSEGRILFMTTNYPERLDAALIRPGRVDMQAKLNLCTSNQLQRMFLRFYPPLSADKSESTELIEAANQFAELIGDGRVSPAEVQGFLLCHKTSWREALSKAESELIKSCQQRYVEKKMS